MIFVFKLQEHYVSMMRIRSGSFRVQEEIQDEDVVPPPPEEPIVIQSFLKDDVLSEVANVSPQHALVLLSQIVCNLYETS